MNNKWQSKEGIVTTVDLNLRWSRGQVKDLAVLKLQQPKARHTETLLHEIVVGLMLNGMRDYLPCFMYVYGGFYCAYPGDEHMAQGEFEDICSGNDEKTINACMLAEYVHDSVGTFLTFCEQPSIDKETKTKALLMLFFALIKARARFGFLHGDLHANNIIVRRLATPAVFAFTYQGQELKIETEYVPVIIDYGRCQIEWNDDVLVPLYGDPIQQERAYCPNKGLPNRDYCYADNLVANGVDVPGWDPVRLLISLDDLSVFLPEVVNNINACFYNLDFDVLDDYPSASQDNEAKWQMQSLTTTEGDAENPDCMLGFMNELLLHNKVRVLCGLAELPPV
jgi:hypothetical protein